MSHCKEHLFSERVFVRSFSECVQSAMCIFAYYTCAVHLSHSIRLFLRKECNEHTQHGFMPCEHMYQSLLPKQFFKLQRILCTHRDKHECITRTHNHEYTSIERKTRKGKNASTEVQSRSRRPSELYGIPFSSTVWCWPFHFSRMQSLPRIPNQLLIRADSSVNFSVATEEGHQIKNMRRLLNMRLDKQRLWYCHLTVSAALVQLSFPNLCLAITAVSLRVFRCV